MCRLLFLVVLAACGAPAPVRHAAVEPVPSAAPASSAPSTVREAPPPPPAAPKLFVIESRDAVPEALRASVPAAFDFRRQVLVGWLRPGNAVQIIATPAVVESHEGVLRVVGVVRHHPAPTRHCPGGIAPNPRLEMGPQVGETRVAGLTPNFLVAVERARVLAARSVDVVYGEDVDDPPTSYVPPNTPCPAYP